MITIIRVSSRRLRLINNKSPHSVVSVVNGENILGLINKNSYWFSSQEQRRKLFEQIPQEDENGTEYTNWILARSQSYNHEIGHLKRKFLKDRFSIHKLTNIKFLCALANHKTQYTLNTNQKIILLAQLNHVFNILGKQKRYYNEFSLLSEQIIQQLKDPHDLICLGTFLSTLSNIGNYNYSVWLGVMDSLLVNKSDEQYDEIFGIVSALNRYRQDILQMTDFHQLKSNMILQFIPVIYRNHLELIRQFIKFNVYNLKQCRILFKCLYASKINQRYFWRSINDWFNIHLKEQLSKKNYEEFFIVNEKSIDKVINDDGMIRPRAILQEVTEIAYIISENLSDSSGLLSEKDKYPIRRFLQFVEDLVLYSIENGGNLYNEYLQQHQNKVQTQTTTNTMRNNQENNDKSSKQDQQTNEKSQQQHQQQKITINDQFEYKSQHQKYRVKLMQRQYKTLFINPIDIKNQTVIQLLVLMRKCCGYDNTGQPASKQNIKSSSSTSQQQQHSHNNNNQPPTFTRPQHLIDTNVLKWLAMRLCKQTMQYTISQLLQIINSEDFLMYAKINLDQLILSKLKTLRNTDVSLKDLKRLLLFLPVNRFTQLECIMVNFLYKSHPSQIHQLTRTIQLQSISFTDQQYSSQFPRKQQHQKWVAHLQFYFLRLPELVNNHDKYYSFEENCYFLYFMLKNQIYWEDHLPNLKDNPPYSNQAHKLMSNYLGEMEKLKEEVKIASYCRGFKLQMNSYFYKLLNYVDLVSFFEGGNA